MLNILEWSGCGFGLLGALLLALSRTVGLFTTGLVLLVVGAGLVVGAPGPWGALLGAFAMLCGLVIATKTLLIARRLMQPADR